MAFKQFTEEQKERARMTCIADIIKMMGGSVKRVGNEYEWLDSGQKVSIKENLWYHQYEQVGGDAISFVKKFMDKSYPEAIEYLLGESAGNFTIAPPEEKKKEAVPFELPPKNFSAKRVFTYLLNDRKIDKDILMMFVGMGMIYESSDYHNVIFVGFDTSGKARHASMRGTSKGSTFRGNTPSSKPEYAFHWNGTSDTLYLFEAPIDMLSFISLNKNGWNKHSYAACHGVGERVMYQMLRDNTHIKNVVLCLDNDDRGIKATKRISSGLTEKGIAHEVLVPTLKDWNEDLKHTGDGGSQSEVDAECQALQPLS